MKKGMQIMCMVLACMLAGILGGCSKEDLMGKISVEQISVEKEENSLYAEGEDGSADDALFEDLSNLEFWFGSGAGAWCTVLHVKADGSFSGNYHDSDMGDYAEEYPDGTCYWCDFSGKFTVPVKLSENTWSVSVESMELKYESGTEEIKDGIKYVYQGPHGLADAEEILIYAPGTSVEELPQEFMSWMLIYGEFADGKLPFYGLYNVKTQEGFSSYEITVPEISDQEAADQEAADQEAADQETSDQEASGQDAAVSEISKAQMDERLTKLESQAKKIKEKIAQDESLTQAELNELSAELYELWDDELNFIWKQLKKQKTQAEMEQITAEEMDWIAEKEGELQKLAEEYGGGSIMSMLCNMKAAELTRARVYELVEYLD